MSMVSVTDRQFDALGLLNDIEGKVLHGEVKELRELESLVLALDLANAGFYTEMPRIIEVKREPRFNSHEAMMRHFGHGFSSYPKPPEDYTSVVIELLVGFNAFDALMLGDYEKSGYSPPFFDDIMMLYEQNPWLSRMRSREVVLPVNFEEDGRKMMVVIHNSPKSTYKGYPLELEPRRFVDSVWQRRRWNELGNFFVAGLVKERK